MSTRSCRDRGSVLPLTLVVTIVMAAIVVAVAEFGTANLRYASVTERRSDQLAAADAAMSYAVNLIRVGRADCIFDSSAAVALPALLEDFNGATASVTCDTVSGGLDGTPVFAIALTGEGLAPSDYLVRTQAGGEKEINGPVYMERATPESFALSNNNGLVIGNAPLVNPTCVSEAALPDDVEFIPDLFGPVCTTEAWYDYGDDDDVFDEPPVPADFTPLIDSTGDGVADSGAVAVRNGRVAIGATTTLPMSDGGTDIVTIEGGFEDVDGPDADATADCRVFQPGRYVRPPDVDGKDAYFVSGDYVFDLRDPDIASPLSLASWALADDIDDDDEAEILVNDATVIAGRVDPSVTTPTLTYSHTDCDAAMAADPGYGATFYMSGLAHLYVEAQGALEIMPRNQGDVADPRYVAIHALCDGHPTTWCVNSPTNVAPSTLTAPSPSSGGDANSHNIVFTKAGQPASLVVNGLIWAPQAELELDNAAATAQARFKGGLVLARTTLQAAASASNFEVGVSLQEIDFGFRLTATGTDTEGGSTRIAAVLDYVYGEPYATAVDVRSWRVCELTC